VYKNRNLSVLTGVGVKFGRKSRFLAKNPYYNQWPAVKT
jgi:hypothetical protein